MRSKLIITGAIGVLAVATLAVNAQNASSKTTSGSVGTLLAATAEVVKADRDEIAIAARATASAAAAAQSARPETSEAAKGDDTDRPATPKLIITAGCQNAIAALKALHQADVAEDASERTTLEPESATALAADKTEDATEAQRWSNALMAARTACLPQPATACQTAIASLQPVLLAMRTEELSELQSGSPTESFSDFAAVRAAFSTVAMACARPE